LQDLLIFHEYLDSGLIPIKGFTPEDIGEFEKLMASLPAVDRRKINRKFRKIFRKLYTREQHANKKHPSLPHDALKKTYGVGGEHPPSKRQLRARRRLVHAEICQIVSKRLDNA